MALLAINPHVQVASEKNYAWSTLHSPRCIIVASLVNYVRATSLETWKANAADASMLCQQNVKTMYFKTLNPRLFNLRQWFEVRFFSVVICKCCKFSTSLLGSCKWEFWMGLKKLNPRRLLNNNKWLNITCLSIFETTFLKLNKKKNSF